MKMQLTRIPMIVRRLNLLSAFEVSPSIGSERSAMQLVEALVDEGI